MMVLGLVFKIIGVLSFMLGFVLLGCAIHMARDEPVYSQNDVQTCTVGVFFIFVGVALMTAFQDA